MLNTLVNRWNIQVNVKTDSDVTFNIAIEVWRERERENYVMANHFLQLVSTRSGEKEMCFCTHRTIRRTVRFELRSIWWHSMSIITNGRVNRETRRTFAFTIYITETLDFTSFMRHCQSTCWVFQLKTKRRKYLAFWSESIFTGIGDEQSAWLVHRKREHARNASDGVWI